MKTTPGVTLPERLMWAEKGGGYIDQKIPGFTYSNVNDQETLGGRLQAAAQVTDKLKLTASSPLSAPASIELPFAVNLIDRGPGAPVPVKKKVV